MQKYLQRLTFVLLLALLAAWAGNSAASEEFRGCLFGSTFDPNEESAFERVSAEDMSRTRSKLERLQLGLGLERPIDIEFGLGTVYAKVECESLAVQKPAKIVIGPKLFKALTEKSGYELDLILAHEIAHILQYAADLQLVDTLCAAKKLDNLKDVELLADLIAGYTMQKIFARSNPVDLIVVLADMSDYEFSNQTHHGMVNERISAFNFGQALSVNNKQLDVAAFMKNSNKLEALLSPTRFYDVTAMQRFEHYTSAMEELYK